MVEGARVAEGPDEEVEGVGLRGDTCGDHVGVEPRDEVGAVVLDGGAEKEVVEGEGGRGRGELGSEGFEVCEGLVDVAPLGEDTDHGNDGRVGNVVGLRG